MPTFQMQFKTSMEIVQKEGTIVLASGMGASVARGLVHGGMTSLSCVLFQAMYIRSLDIGEVVALFCTQRQVGKGNGLALQE